MNLAELQQHWNAFGEDDPFWAILTDPSKAGRVWDSEEFFRTGRQHVAHLLARIAALGLPLGRSRAMDFGSGVGRVTQALATHFDEVHGVDIARSMVRLATAFNAHGPRCQYHVNERNDLSLFPDEAFDLVHSHITLQHIEPRYVKRYIPELLRVVRAGGLLVFQLPSRPRIRGKPVVVVVKDLLKLIGPRPLIAVYRQLAWRHTEMAAAPHMEMHGVSRRRVVRLLHAHGGRLVDAVDDSQAAPGWIGFQYFVVKSQRAGAAGDA